MFLKKLHFALITAILTSVSAGLLAQTPEELCGQLCGKNPVAAPRSAAQWTDDYQKAIDYLLPLMSDENIKSRYPYQIMLQDMGSYASRPGAKGQSEALARVMAETLEKVKMPDTVRNWFILQLGRIDPGVAVETLARILSGANPIERDYARQALQLNPNPAATEVLLKELAATKETTWKIGLIEALGQRQAGAAVEPLSQALADQDAGVAGAAAMALSRIAGPQSSRLLCEMLNKPYSAAQTKAAQGLLDRAQQRTAVNDYSQAAELYRAVYNWASGTGDVSTTTAPLGLRTAAMTGLLQCRPETAADEIVKMIRDKNPKVRAAAVHVARALPTQAATAALSGILGQLEPETQKQVLALIAERGDLSAIQFVLPLLDSPDGSVQEEAIVALTRIGCELSAESLLPIAAGRGTAAKAAYNGLSVMVGPRVEETLQARAVSGDENIRIAALGLLAERRVPAAAQTLLACAAEDSEPIRTAAFKAMMAVLEPGDTAALTQLLANADGPTVANGLLSLKSVLAKAPDKAAAAQFIIAQISGASPDGKIVLLKSLDTLGGAAALEVVAKAAKSADEKTADAGIRTLSNWPDYQAAQWLLAIAKDPQASLTHYVLAVNGISRLIKESLAVSPEERTALSLDTLKAARRDDEKKLVISAMGSLPDKTAARSLLELTENETLKAEAAMALIDLAGRIRPTDAPFANDLLVKVRQMNISEAINRLAEKKP